MRELILQNYRVKMSGMGGGGGGRVGGCCGRDKDVSHSYLRHHPSFSSALSPAGGKRERERGRQKERGVREHFSVMQQLTTGWNVTELNITEWKDVMTPGLWVVDSSARKYKTQRLWFDSCGERLGSLPDNTQVQPLNVQKKKKVETVYSLFCGKPVQLISTVSLKKHQKVD